MTMTGPLFLIKQTPRHARMNGISHFLFEIISPFERANSHTEMESKSISALNIISLCIVTLYAPWSGLSANHSSAVAASFDECVKLIGYLPNLTYAEMCDCKLSNRQMESLIEKFPNIDFVWKIYFGRWSARTDIVAFSTLNHGASEFGEDDFAPLFKYCTDLEVLDLGHNSIRDISAVTNLQKLEVLIVMDNFISDMTPVAQLPNLVYAELYTNPWRDASFISDMKAIRDLNIANCFIADYSFLNDLPATLENIWISDNFFDVPSDEMREIRKKYPNCAIEDFWPATWYENRWYNERWAGVKTACDYWQYVTAYDYWDNITFDAPADVVIEEHEQRYKPPQEETSAETEDTDSDGEN